MWRIGLLDLHFAFCILHFAFCILHFDAQHGQVAAWTRASGTFCILHIAFAFCIGFPNFPGRVADASCFEQGEPYFITGASMMFDLNAKGSLLFLRLFV